jgi:nucleoside-diphosphate-sugar epimerase
VSVDVVVFGAGFTGRHVCSEARQQGLTVLGVVRSEESAAALRELGLEVSTDDAATVARRAVGAKTHAVITFPPDGETDAALAPLLSGARAVSYLSTTGVYEDLEGVVDDTTPLPEQASPKYAAVRAAEQAYRAVGGAILRSPGIYGDGRGIDVRLKRGDFKLSGDGSRYASRIHVEDLARLLLASAATPRETFVVGDLEPCRQIDMVSWLCEQMQLPLPPCAPLETVHETLRRNRRIDAARALSCLGVTLRYPTYRDGFRRGYQLSVASHQPETTN